MSSLVLFVPGIAAPQGSKRHVGKGIMIESSAKVKPWRESIRWSILEVWKGPPMTGAISVYLDFIMPRPASTPKRKTPPAIKRPDIDKLARACLDAIGSAGVYGDDSQVTRLSATKRIAEIGESPGLQLQVEPMGATS